MDAVRNGDIGTRFPCYINRVGLKCALSTDFGGIYALDIDFLMRVVGIAMTVAVSCMILSRCGRDDQASLVSLAGIVTVLIILFTEIASLIDTVRGIFGF